jgi:hypothetical protein
MRTRARMLMPLKTLFEHMKADNLVRLRSDPTDAVIKIPPEEPMWLDVREIKDPKTESAQSLNLVKNSKEKFKSYFQQIIKNQGVDDFIYNIILSNMKNINKMITLREQDAKDMKLCNGILHKKTCSNCDNYKVKRKRLIFNFRMWTKLYKDFFITVKGGTTPEIAFTGENHVRIDLPEVSIRVKRKFHLFICRLVREHKRIAIMNEIQIDQKNPATIERQVLEEGKMVTRTVPCITVVGRPLM